MEIISADSQGIARAVTLLREGGVVVHATETCYGLACDLTNPEAVARLFAIKDRPETQPVSALLPDVAASDAWVEWNDAARTVARDQLPGPVTLVLPLRPERIGHIFPVPGGGATLGIRVSPHPVARALATALARPLATTSANVHGHDNPYSMKDLDTQYATRELAPDLLLDSGTLKRRKPSRVLDFATGSGTVLRT